MVTINKVIDSNGINVTQVSLSGQDIVTLKTKDTYLDKDIVIDFGSLDEQRNDTDYNYSIKTLPLQNQLTISAVAGSDRKDTLVFSNLLGEPVSWHILNTTIYTQTNEYDAKMVIACDSEKNVTNIWHTMGSDENGVDYLENGCSSIYDADTKTLTVILSESSETGFFQTEDCNYTLFYTFFPF